MLQMAGSDCESDCSEDSKRRPVCNTMTWEDWDWDLRAVPPTAVTTAMEATGAMFRKGMQGAGAASPQPQYDVKLTPEHAPGSSILNAAVRAAGAHFQVILSRSLVDSDATECDEDKQTDESGVSKGAHPLLGVGP